MFDGLIGFFLLFLIFETPKKSTKTRFFMQGILRIIILGAGIALGIFLIIPSFTLSWRDFWWISLLGLCSVVFCGYLLIKNTYNSVVNYKMKDK